MKHSLLVILELLTAAYSFRQQTCDGIDLQADKALLQNFRTQFKDAANNKNKAKLANLCRFLFTCDCCILDTNKQRSKPCIKVTKLTFDKSQYQILFADRLVNEVNKRNLPENLFVFQPYFGTVDKKCSYSFRCIARDENAQHPGMQHWFDI